MKSPPRPAHVRTLDIEGQPVRYIETDGKRLWLCECAKFNAAPGGLLRSHSRRDHAMHSGRIDRDSMILGAIQCRGALSTAWTPAAAVSQHSPVRVLAHINKLDDCFGDFLVRVSCSCGTVREITPEALARLVGWKATLDELAQRMRCSQCGKKAAEIMAIARPRPRGMPKNPHSDRGHYEVSGAMPARAARNTRIAYAIPSR